MIFNRIALLCLLVVAGLGYINAQNLSRSPYSRYGLGEIEFQGFQNQRAMGRLTQAMGGPFSISIANPASYSSLKYVNYNFGAAAFSSVQRNTNQERISNNAGLSYLALGLPFKKNSGLGGAFGFLPYSSTGYNESTLAVDSSGIGFNNQFTGTGGINKVFIGTGYDFTPKISFGANAAYLWGQRIDAKTVIFPDTLAFLPYKEDVTTYVRGFNFDLGFQFKDTLVKQDTSNNKLRPAIVHRFGATINMSTNMNISRDYFARTFNAASVFQSTKDTIAIFTGATESFRLPLGFAAGYSIEKINNWLIGIEYRQTKWSSLSNKLNSNQTLVDQHSFSLGGYYQPSIYFNRGFSNYIKNIRYMAGIRYELSEVYVNNTQINNFGINFGLSLPVLHPYRRNIISSIDINFEYIQRGTLNNNLIREDYYRIGLGFTLSDQWFDRIKYD